MRNRLLSSLGAVAILLGAAAAQAATLTSATWFQTAQGFPLTRTTQQLGATGSSTAGSIAASLSYPQFTVTFFVPKDPTTGVLDLGIKVTQGGAQAITASPSMASGTPGIPGTVIVMTASHLAGGVNASMYMIGVNTLVEIPLSNGKAGLFTSTFVISGVSHQITVDFFAWTPHTLTFMGLTSKGVALPDVTAAGSFNLTANGGGTVTLVSPSKVSINGDLNQRRTASFTTLKLNFVPEPGTVLLLGAAALGLLALRRRS